MPKPTPRKAKGKPPAKPLSDSEVNKVAGGALQAYNPTTGAKQGKTN